MNAHRRFIECAHKDLSVFSDSLRDRQALFIVRDFSFDHFESLKPNASFLGRVVPENHAILKHGMAGINAGVDNGNLHTFAGRFAFRPLPQFWKFDVFNRNKQRVEAEAIFRLFGRLITASTSTTGRRRMKRRYIRFELQGFQELLVDDFRARQCHDEKRNIVTDAQIRVIIHLAAILYDDTGRFTSVLNLNEQSDFGIPVQLFPAVDEARPLGLDTIHCQEGNGQSGCQNFRSNHNNTFKRTA